MSENVSLTPPQVVALSDDPVAALVAFVAQELEAWGFGVDAKQRAVLVQAEHRNFMVGIQECK